MPDRLEREIDEILKRVDSLPEARKRLRPSRWQRFKNSLAGLPSSVAAYLTRLSLGHVMIVGFVLIVIGFVFRGDSFASWALIAGLVLLLTAFVVSIVRGRRPAAAPRQQMRWRGRVIEMDEPTLGDRMRGLWRRKKR